VSCEASRAAGGGEAEAEESEEESGGEAGEEEKLSSLGGPSGSWSCQRCGTKDPGPPYDEPGEQQRYCLACMDLNKADAYRRDEAAAAEDDLSVPEYQAERRREIVERFRAGETRRQLSERFGVSPVMVSRAIRHVLGKGAKPGTVAVTSRTAPPVPVPEKQLERFLRESLKIEGIDRDPTEEELEATQRFLQLEKVTVEDVAALVDVYEPGAVLRTEPGLNVRVGDHVAPAGGPEMYHRLANMLKGMPTASPLRWHRSYERLHPFSDGNGRSGRALWAWQMVRRREGLALGFLHRWYYSTLE
jgi:hypothetical protein